MVYPAQIERIRAALARRLDALSDVQLMRLILSEPCNFERFAGSVAARKVAGASLSSGEQRFVQMLITVGNAHDFWIDEQYQRSQRLAEAAE
jgi:hypothetical protein